MRKPLLITVAVFLLFGLLAGTVWASMWGTYMGYPVARIQVNGQIVTPSSPAIIIEGRTYVPLRFVSEALGAQVGWDAETYTVTINTNSGNETPVTGNRIGKGLPKTFSEKGVSVTLTSLEATPSGTILKVKVTNNTSSEVMFGASTAQLVAGSKQFDNPSSWDLTFASNLKPGVTKEGVLKFPALPADVNTVKFYVHYFIMPGLDMIEAEFEVEL